jgi:hypothetical protein
VVRSVTLAVIVGLTVVGCSDGSSDAEIATTTCEALRGVNNRIITIVNESVAGINLVEPRRRLAPLLEGLNGVRLELEVWDAEVADLDLPDVPEVAILRAQLHDGVTDAVAELDDQAAEFVAGMEAVQDDEVAGVVGTWFNAVEKVVSSIEPEIVRFERPEFKQAFLDDPACRNVIQPFVND